MIEPERPALREVLAALDGVTDGRLAEEILVARGLLPDFTGEWNLWCDDLVVGLRAMASLGIAGMLRLDELARRHWQGRGVECYGPLPSKVVWHVHTKDTGLWPSAQPQRDALALGAAVQLDMTEPRVIVTIRPLPTETA